MTPSRIVVLGAAGLIGEALFVDLRERGYGTVAVARRTTPAQDRLFGSDGVRKGVVDMTEEQLGGFLSDLSPDVVVNCIGILQDGAGAMTDVHEDFVGRLARATAAAETSPLLVHLSVPGTAADDPTEFSRTKRAGEDAVAASGAPFAILRPGFVFAPDAYGGSALLRALAALPFDLPKDLEARSFRGVSVSDVARTVAHLTDRHASGETTGGRTWDLVGPDPRTLGDTLRDIRGWLGGPERRIRLPRWALRTGSLAGDAAQLLGWRPPVRSTALAELERGVDGDPDPWLRETGIVPASLADEARRRPATIQESWFARLFLLKPLVFGTLAVFWIASGAIALTVAFDEASAILVRHGFAKGTADLVTVASSLLDISVGAAVAFRRTAFLGLAAGVAVSLFYMASAAAITPDMWIEPLGALVKTFPAIVLMLVATAILPERR